jgi:hypothetical protein
VGVLVLPAFATTLVLPSSLSGSEGAGQLPVVAAAHVQQVFDRSLFTSFGVPIIITGLAVRPDGVNNTALASTIPMQLYVGLTTTAPGFLDFTYVNNWNVETPTNVFLGVAALNTANNPAGGPKPFDYSITFTTPYLYDPFGSNNLLIDLANNAPTVTNPVGGLLAFDTIGGAVDPGLWQMSNIVGVGSVASIAGNGFVVQFTFDTVPEPGTVGMVAVGLLGLAWGIRRSSRRAQ